MTLVATPEGPTVLDSSLRQAMRTTGYVSSVNGKQGAVVLDIGGGSITVPAGTPDYRVAMALAGVATWRDLASFPGGYAHDVTPQQFATGVGTGGDDTSAFAQAAAYVAANGGRVKLNQRAYQVNGVVFDSGVVFVVDSAGQRQTGKGVICKISPAAGYAGYMFDAALYQIVAPSIDALGTYTLTGGYGGSGTTAAISPGEAYSSIQTKVRTLPGFGVVTVTSDPSSDFAYRINMDASIGDPSSSVGAVNGALAPAKLTVGAGSLTAGSVTVTRHVVESSGFSGIEFAGGVTSSGSARTGGIRARLANKFNAHAISGSGCTKGVIVGGGDAWVIERANIQNFGFATDTPPPLALGAYTGFGADHFILGGEYAGIGGTTGTALIDPATLTHTAIAMHAQTSWVIGVLTELADVGIFNGGTHNVLEACRADLCGAHGIQEPTYASDNRYRDTRVLSSGLAADNTYDGLHLDGIGHKVNGVSGVLATNVATANRLRYLVYENDVTTDYLTARRYPVEVEGLSGDVNIWSSDIYFSTLGYPCYKGLNGGNPAGRPLARLAKNLHWADTVAGRDTRSDGTYWRDMLGEIVGNVLPETLSTLRASSGWTAALATCTPSRVDGHTDFAMPWCGQAVTLAAGVTAGYAAAAGTPGTLPPADPGRFYTAAVHALGPSGTTVSFTVTWKDAGGATISTTAATTPIAVGTTDTLALAAIPTAAPSNAAKAVLNIIFTRAGLTAGDTFKFARATLVPGTTATDCEAS